MADTCIFCEILAGRAKGRIVHEDVHSVALLDINPFSPGHCLVIPRRHVQFWHDLSAEEAASLFQVAQETARRIKQAYRPDFVAMYARGRRIPHTHIFLVPTFGGDPLDRFFNTLEGFQEQTTRLADIRSQKSLDDAWQRLVQS